ncbi:MAG: antitoxin MazE family protein [Pseudomonadota bacterium]
MATPVNERVQKRRQALRMAGLRPIQIWVPDTRRQGFAEECLRQSLMLHGDQKESDMLNWIEEAADTEGWE